MVNALWITLIGMGLVFFAILLLWGLMALLVRFTTDPVQVEDPELEPEPALELVEIPTGDQESGRRRRAAAAAVAVALLLQKVNGAAHSSRPAVSTSAWQAAHRAGQINQRANPIRRR